MESFQPEKESTISKVVGTDEEVNKKVLDIHKYLVANQVFLEVEREETPEERAVLSEVLINLAEFPKSYGASLAPISLDNIHIIDENLLKTKEGYEDVKNKIGDTLAYFDTFNQYIILFSSKQVSKTHMALNVAHELIHAHSFQSISVSKKKGDDQPTYETRRVGMSIASRDGSTNYLNGIEEAIVSELTKRFYEQYIKSSLLFKEEQEQTEKIIQELNEQHPEEKETHYDIYYAYEVGDDFKFFEHTYSPERKQLHKIMQDVLEAFPERFQTKDDVFKEFVKAHAQGNILPIARLIEETYKNKEIPALDGSSYNQHLSKNAKKRAFRILAEEIPES